MHITLKVSALKETKWYGYAVRFIFGGIITVFTGIITSKYGPVVGGLFLAFPSIFPASLTLAQSHKKKEAQKEGQSKSESQEEGEETAYLTAVGTSLGTFGLILFGLTIWKFSDLLAPWLVLLLALVGWFVTAVFTWWIVIGRKVEK